MHSTADARRWFDCAHHDMFLPMILQRTQTRQHFGMLEICYHEPGMVISGYAAYERYTMPHLFSPVTIAHKKLPNRIVMGSCASGLAMADGFISDDLLSYYVRRAHGGVGLIVTEPVRVVPPAASGVHAHVGLYDDAFVPQLRFLVQAVHSKGARLILMLDEPCAAAEMNARELHTLAERFVQAAWRALAADCDGIMLSAADGGVLHTIISPHLNRRFDVYGGTLTERLRLPLQIIEGIHDWLGKRLIVGFRLIADDFTTDGITMQDARVIARRVVTAGVNLLDVTVDDQNTTVPVARFPGWMVPLAESIKRVVPEVPVMCSGLLGDPHLADSVIRDGSADLIMLRQTLRTHPDWPKTAYKTLVSTST